MTKPGIRDVGCGIVLAFLIGEIAAAGVFGYVTFQIGVHRLGWLEDNTIPVSVFAGFAGAFIVDRWAKRVIGDSILFGLIALVPTGI